jgi:hypothetical protein
MPMIFRSRWYLGSYKKPAYSSIDLTDTKWNNKSHLLT